MCPRKVLNLSLVCNTCHWHMVTLSNPCHSNSLSCSIQGLASFECKVLEYWTNTRSNMFGVTRIGQSNRFSMTCIGQSNHISMTTSTRILNKSKFWRWNPNFSTWRPFNFIIYIEIFPGETIRLKHQQKQC